MAARLREDVPNEQFLEWNELFIKRGKAELKLQLERLKIKPGQENTPKIDRSWLT